LQRGNWDESTSATAARISEGSVEIALKEFMATHPAAAFLLISFSFWDSGLVA
jgi:hypothetical protein